MRSDTDKPMWEIFRETDQLPLQLPARATVCGPELLCLLFREGVVAAFSCGISSRWLVDWTGLYHPERRAHPDIAARASGMPIIKDGKLLMTGGTS